MGFERSTDLDLYEEGIKKMGFGRGTNLKSYGNKSIEAEKSWVYFNEINCLSSFDL